MSASRLNHSKLATLIQRAKHSLFTFVISLCSANAFAKDILQDQAADAIDTFKGTVLTLIIAAEILGAYNYWHKSRDLKGTLTGLVFVLLLTGWASTAITGK